LVDLGVKPIARGELRRFADRLTTRALVDEQSREFREAGLGYIRFSDDELFERLLESQRLIRLPLVRAKNAFSAGVNEPAWKQLLAALT
jgi:arsenate reductase-like glutaredoxin family protein